MTGEVRGREAVEAALIQAAADSLAEGGARAMSVRDVAARAGVNHGQVHHYFGSKDALVRAAMRELATEHFENAMQRAGGHAVPPALSLAHDVRYWHAVVRLCVEGELDIVRTEIDEAISVPRRALEVLAAQNGLAAPDLDAKFAVAATSALQIGWVAMEEFLFLVVDATPEEREELRSRIRDLATTIYRDALPESR